MNRINECREIILKELETVEIENSSKFREIYFSTVKYKDEILAETILNKFAYGEDGLKIFKQRKYT